MALLTGLSLEQAKLLSGQLGLEVVALEPVARGVNSNFKLELAGGGLAFMRVCEEASQAELQEQSRLLVHLVRRGLPTVAPLPRLDGGAAVLEHAGKAVSVFPFCEGRVCCQAAVREQHLLALGGVLGAMHAATKDFVMASADRFGPAELRCRAAALRQAAHGGDIDACLRRLQPLLDELEALPSLPSDSVVHGDLFRDNVLWRPDASLSGVLDFECAAPGLAAFDLMVCLLAWCFGERLQRPLARALMRGYQALRPLRSDELRACYDHARLACVRFMITRIESYELCSGAIFPKDFRRFGARLTALEAIGAAGFVAWLQP